MVETKPYTYSDAESSPAALHPVAGKAKKDELLMNSLRQGDMAAYGALYDAHHPVVTRRLVHKFRISDVEAEDLASQTLITVREKCDQFDAAKASFATWRNVVSDSLTLTHLRRTRTRLVELEPEYESSLLRTSPEAQKGIDNVLAVMKLVSQLPEKQRKAVEIVIKAELEGRDVSELGGDEPTFACRLHHARKKLREWFRSGPKDGPGSTGGGSASTGSKTVRANRKLAMAYQEIEPRVLEVLKLQTRDAAELRLMLEIVELARRPESVRRSNRFSLSLSAMKDCFRCGPLLVAALSVLLFVGIPTAPDLADHTPSIVQQAKMAGPDGMSTSRVKGGELKTTNTGAQPETKQNQLMSSSIGKSVPRAPLVAEPADGATESLVSIYSSLTPGDGTAPSYSVLSAEVLPGPAAGTYAFRLPDAAVPVNTASLKAFSQFSAQNMLRKADASTAASIRSTWPTGFRQVRGGLVPVTLQLHWSTASKRFDGTVALLRTDSPKSLAGYESLVTQKMGPLSYSGPFVVSGPTDSEALNLDSLAMPGGRWNFVWSAASAPVPAIGLIPDGAFHSQVRVGIGRFSFLTAVPALTAADSVELALCSEALGKTELCNFVPGGLQSGSPAGDASLGALLFANRTQASSVFRSGHGHRVGDEMPWGQPFLIRGRSRVVTQGALGRF